MLDSHQELDDLTARVVALLAEVEQGPGGRVRADVVMSGIARAAGPRTKDLDHAVLRGHLLDAGRHTPGLRAPRSNPRSHQGNIAS